MNHPYRYLFRRFLLWLRRSVSFLWLVFVAGYLAFVAGQATYRNYQAQEDTAKLQQQLQKVKQDKARLEALLVYYQTDSFKEKELRRTLLMKMPNEKAYALPESSVAKQVEEELVQSVAAANVKKTSNSPIWEQWFWYIITGEKEA